MKNPAPVAMRRGIFALCLLFLMFGIMGEAYGAVKVSRGKVVSGRSFRMQKYTWATFECLIDNQDGVKREVAIRVFAKDGTPQMNIFSGVLEVPAHTKSVYRLPLLVESAEQHNVEVFVNNNRLPLDHENESNVKYMAPREQLVGILNDSDQENFNILFSLKKLDKKVLTNLFTANYLPDDGKLYRHLQTLFIHDPDFSRYSTVHYNAILDYAANGGNVCFISPKGAMKAAKTPLSVLLPVVPLEIRSVTSVPQLNALFPDLKSIKPDLEFLSSIPKETGIDFLTHDGTPLFREMAFGLGTVKLLAVPLIEEQFEKNDAYADLVELLLSGQRVTSSRQQFSSSLDQLTGFPIPQVSTVRNLLLFYLLLIVVVIVVAVVVKRAALGWLTAAVIALLMTAHILNMARSTVGSKNSLLAEVRLEYDTPMPFSESYLAYFAASEEGLTAGHKDLKHATFLGIPSQQMSGILAQSALSQDRPQDLFGSSSSRNSQEARAAKRNQAPMEFRLDQLGNAQIYGLNFAPRTSKQFMAFTVSDKIPTGSKGLHSGPTVSLNRKGMELLPWTCPKELEGAEAAFLVMPGGVIGMTRKDNTYVPEKSEQFFQNPLLRSIRDAIDAAAAHEIPSLALVYPATESEYRVGNANEVQGKRIVMVPASIRLTEKQIRIPKEMLLLSPVDATSKLYLDGHRVRHLMPSQAGFNAVFQMNLPSFLSVSDPKKISVKPNAIVTGEILLTPRLRGTEKNVFLDPEKSDKGSGTFVFEGPKLRQFVSATKGNFILEIVSKEGKRRFAGGEEEISMAQWQLKGVEVEVDVNLPETVSLPAAF